MRPIRKIPETHDAIAEGIAKELKAKNIKTGYPPAESCENWYRWEWYKWGHRKHHAHITIANGKIYAHYFNSGTDLANPNLIEIVREQLIRHFVILHYNAPQKPKHYRKIRKRLTRTNWSKWQKRPNPR